MNASVKTIARTGGLLYLVNIVLGFLAIGYVPSVIIVSGNPAATANNILLHETLYRMGLVSHIIILLTNIPLAVVFYALFKTVSNKITQLVVFFTLTGTAIEAVSQLCYVAPLVFLKGQYLKVFAQEQLQAQSYACFQLQAVGFNIALVFFGCYGVAIGYLIFRSALLPRIIGLFMMIGGTCYIVNSFANFIAPVFAKSLVPYILIPSGLAELSFCLWLLAKGVNPVRHVLR